MAYIKCGGSAENDGTSDVACSNEDNPFVSADGIGGKKPKKFKKATIALISVFVILIGIVSIGKLFFNRDFMELIQGKTRYAQNIELATAKSSASQMVTLLDKGVNLSKGYAKPKTLNSDLQFNITLEDQFLKDMNVPAEGFGPIQQAVKYLNTLKINTKTLVGENGTQTSSTLTDSSALKLTVKSLTDHDGKTYLHIPQLLDRYLSDGDQETAFQLSPYSLSKMKYDPKKLQASLEKLAAVYSDSLSSAEMKAENNQSVTVDGTTVQGQKLTASLTAAQTSALVKAIAQTAKNDNDLYTFVSDNYGLFSAIAGSTQSSSEKLTKENYGKLIDKLLSNLNLEKDGVTFSANSYLSQNGTLLAHCYESHDKTDKGQLNYLITDKKYAAEFLVDQKEGFTFTDTKTGEGTGDLQLKIHSEDLKNIGVTVHYSGLKKISFLGSDTIVGKCVFSLYDPNHELGKYAQQAGLSSDQLDQLSLTIETALEADKLNNTFQLSIPRLLSVSMAGKTSGVSGSVSIPPQPEPSQVLDLSKDKSGEAMNEITMNGITFLSKTLEKDPELAAVLSGFGISKEQLAMLAAFSQA